MLCGGGEGEWGKGGVVGGKGSGALKGQCQRLPPDLDRWNPNSRIKTTISTMLARAACISKSLDSKSVSITTIQITNNIINYYYIDN
jgi:hypothetical protein